MDIWKNLESLRRKLELEASDYATLMGLSAQRYLQLKTRKKSPSLLSVAGLSQKLGISLEALGEAKFDPKTLAKARKNLLKIGTLKVRSNRADESKSPR